MSRRRRLSIERLAARIVFSVEPVAEQSLSQVTTVESVDECAIAESSSIQSSESLSKEVVSISDVATPTPNNDATVVPFSAEPLDAPHGDVEADEAVPVNATVLDALFTEPLPLGDSESVALLAPEISAATFAASRLTNLTPDEKKAIDLCGDDAECRKQVENLIEILRDRDAPPWFNLETITYGGRCVWWSTHCHSDFLDANRDGVPLDMINMTEVMKYYIGPNPLWSEHHYVKITLPNGTHFYADVYWLGGGDHIFFDVPWSLVDADEYIELLEANTAAMDAMMH